MTDDGHTWLGIHGHLGFASIGFEHISLIDSMNNLDLVTCTIEHGSESDPSICSTKLPSPRSIDSRISLNVLIRGQRFDAS